MHGPLQRVRHPASALLELPNCKLRRIRPHSAPQRNPLFRILQTQLERRKGPNRISQRNNALARNHPLETQPKAPASHCQAFRADNDRIASQRDDQRLATLIGKSCSVRRFRAHEVKITANYAQFAAYFTPRITAGSSRPIRVSSPHRNRLEKRCTLQRFEDRV
jgi:hypothetical protein